MYTDHLTRPGLPVTVTVTGTQRPLPPGVDQAAYRIVQEALTNVSRHAGHACASVRLHYTPDVLTVQVDDDGKPSGTRPAGPVPAATRRPRHGRPVARALQAAGLPQHRTDRGQQDSARPRGR
jgi:hypothetical protein